MTHPTTISELRESSAATITRKQAAEVLGVDPRTVSAAITDGTIPALKIGRRIVIPREKFIELFATTAAAA